LIYPVKRPCAMRIMEQSNISRAVERKQTKGRFGTVTV
jgi:hypothetical protein